MSSQFRLYMLGLVCLLFLVACGGNGTSGGDFGNAGDLTVTAKGSSLAFEETTLRVSTGAEVTLTLDNSLSTLEHNWVLVRGGETEARTIAAAALAVGRTNQYLPADASNIIAATQVLDPGETETIAFVAPEPGIYFYICTVPGHYPLMRGRLVVE